MTSELWKATADDYRRHASKLIYEAWKLRQLARQAESEAARLKQMETRTRQPKS